MRAALDTLHQSSPFDRYSPQVYYPAQTSIDAPPEPAALPDAW